MLHLQLKEKTKDQHASLEKIFLSKIRDINGPDDYRELLMKIYGYYAVVEKTLKKFLTESIVHDYQSRLKCLFLQNDIRALRVSSVESVRLCIAVPEIKSFYHALGVLYVFEGSTLGGQIIARMVGAKLNNQAALSFFRSYGDETPEMWNQFKKFLDNPFTEEQRQQIIGSALMTFITFKNWLQSA